MYRAGIYNFIERITDKLRKPRYILTEILKAYGIRGTRKRSVILTTISVVSIYTASQVKPFNDDIILNTAMYIVAMLIPAIYSYIQHRSITLYTASLPIYTALLTGNLLTLLTLPIYALLLEDFTIHMQPYYEEITTITRHVRYGLLDKYSILIVAITTGIYVYAYIQVGDPIILVYPLSLLSIIVISSIYTPFKAMEIESPYDVLSIVRTRLNILSSWIYRMYSKPSMLNKGRKAGIIGIRYELFSKRISELYVFGFFLSVNITPLLYILMGIYALAIPVAYLIIYPLLPSTYLSLRISSRRGMIDRFYPIILILFASLKRIERSFTDIMQDMVERRGIGRTFGIYDEAKIYLDIFSVRPVEELAVKEYGKTVPHDAYRDFITTMQTIEYSSGYNEAYRNIISRLEEESERYVATSKDRIENIANSVLGVLVMITIGLPIISILGGIEQVYIQFTFMSLLTIPILLAVYTMTIPELPSEYTITRENLRNALITFLIVSIVLNVATYILTPYLYPMILIPNLIATLSVSYYMLYRNEIRLDNELLNKMRDFVSLFISSMNRTNSVVLSLRELSMEADVFSEPIRKYFRDFSTLLENINVRNIDLRGTFWKKLVSFLSIVAMEYGSTPSSLYRAVSHFSTSWKKVRQQAVSLAIMFAFITLLAGTIVYYISHTIIAISMDLGGGEVGGMELPILRTEPEVLNNLYISILVFSTLAGSIVGGYIHGHRRATYTGLILYIVMYTVILLIRITSPLPA